MDKVAISLDVLFSSMPLCQCGHPRTEVATTCLSRTNGARTRTGPSTRFHELFSCFLIQVGVYAFDEILDPPMGEFLVAYFHPLCPPFMQYHRVSCSELLGVPVCSSHGIL